MEVFLATLLLAITFLGIGFAGIAIKIWAKKDGEFAGTCASNSLFLNEEGEACSLCGALPDQKCKSEDNKSLTQKKEEPEFSPFV
jgi:hypothetical protein